MQAGASLSIGPAAIGPGLSPVALDLTAMSLTLGFAIYFLVWWLTLFAVLPWGVRPQGSEGAPGTDPGAPQRPRMLLKLLWTTVVATAVFAAGVYIHSKGLVTLDGLATLMGMPN